MLFKHRVKMTMAQVRELFPSRAPNVLCQSEGEEIRLTVNRSPGRLVTLLSYFFTLPLRKTILLDRFGARVWERCDGQTPAREIVASLAQQEGWPQDRTERAVLQFLSMLSERRLVGFSTSSTTKLVPCPHP